MNAPGVYVHIDTHAEALELVREFVSHEDQPCSFDHHGNCQEHGWFFDAPEEKCPIYKGRKLLGLST